MSRFLSAAGDLALTFFVKLPLIVLIALPAFCLGYVWTIAAGAFLWGIDAHGWDKSRAFFVRVKSEASE